MRIRFYVCIGLHLDPDICMNLFPIFNFYRTQSRNLVPSSFVDPDPYWIRIQDKMEAKDVRFKILFNNSETQLIKNSFM